MSDEPNIWVTFVGGIVVVLVGGALAAILTLAAPADAQVVVGTLAGWLLAFGGAVAWLGWRTR